MKLSEIIALITGIFALVTAIAKLLKTVFSIRNLRRDQHKIGADQQRIGLILSDPDDPQALEARAKLGKPDPSPVKKWAVRNLADNPYNMGPKKWERCLYDLGYVDGVKHELAFESDGKLRYQ